MTQGAKKMPEMAQEEDLRQEYDDLAEEFGEFAYIVSHDLSAPLRHIKSFSEMVYEQHKESLDEKSQSYFDHIFDATNKGQRLLDGLLSYSRLNTHKLEYTQLNMEHALASAKRRLEKAIETTDATITSDALPEFFGDPSQIVDLFCILIDNAIKFQPEGQAPKIHIAYEDLGSHHQLCISDNGIGIESKHLDKVFAVFARAVMETDYPGIGMGLTLAKKIVQNHKGKIWVESEPAKGSTFYATFSKTI